jgi:3-mercaptopyruvate sulfurtransferase SseA
VAEYYGGSGFENVFILDGGVEGWRKSGYPLE